MYFTLPKSQDRPPKPSLLNKRSSNSSMMSTDSNAMAEERITEIIQNLDDHWGSPPILTPDTLAHILSHQWTNEELVNQEEIKKDIVFIESIHTLTTAPGIQGSCKSNSSCKSCDPEQQQSRIYTNRGSLQSMDTEDKHDVTKELKSDPVIQKFIADKEVASASTAASSSTATPAAAVVGNEEHVMQHLIELLQQHNMNNKTKKADNASA
ncbi:hypothetical protein MBANPS3_000639 [Mucor bainieri]